MFDFATHGKMSFYAAGFWSLVVPLCAVGVLAIDRLIAGELRVASFPLLLLFYPPSFGIYFFVRKTKKRKGRERGKILLLLAIVEGTLSTVLSGTNSSVLAE